MDSSSSSAQQSLETGELKPTESAQLAPVANKKKITELPYLIKTTILRLVSDDAPIRRRFASPPAPDFGNVPLSHFWALRFVCKDWLQLVGAETRHSLKLHVNLQICQPTPSGHVTAYANVRLSESPKEELFAPVPDGRSSGWHTLKSLPGVAKGFLMSKVDNIQVNLCAIASSPNALALQSYLLPSLIKHFDLAAGDEIPVRVSVCEVAAVDFEQMLGLGFSMAAAGGDLIPPQSAQFPFTALKFPAALCERTEGPSPVTIICRQLVSYGERSLTSLEVCPFTLAEALAALSPDVVRFENMEELKLELTDSARDFGPQAGSIPAALQRFVSAFPALRALHLNGGFLSNVDLNLQPLMNMTYLEHVSLDYNDHFYVAHHNAAWHQQNQQPSHRADEGSHSVLAILHPTVRSLSLSVASMRAYRLPSLLKIAGPADATAKLEELSVNWILDLRYFQRLQWTFADLFDSILASPNVAGLRKLNLCFTLASTAGYFDVMEQSFAKLEPVMPKLTHLSISCIACFIQADTAKFDLKAILCALPIRVQHVDLPIVCDCPFSIFDRYPDVVKFWKEWILSTVRLIAETKPYVLRFRGHVESVTLKRQMRPSDIVPALQQLLASWTPFRPGLFPAEAGDSLAIKHLYIATREKVSAVSNLKVSSFHLCFCVWNSVSELLQRITLILPADVQP